MIFNSGGEQSSTGEANDIWPHRASYPRVDGGPDSIPTNDFINGQRVTIKTYTIMGTKTGLDLGTTVHEFYHDLGLPDAYNTANNDIPQVVGNWCVMDGGCNGDYPGIANPYYRTMLGWANVITCTSYKSISNLNAASIDSTVYKIPHYGSLKTDSEYYMLENRQKALVGTMLDSTIPGSGLMIWHIDERIGNAEDNNVNNFALKRVIIEPADSTIPYIANNNGEAGDPWIGTDNKYFYDYSNPNSTSNDTSKYDTTITITIPAYLGGGTRTDTIQYTTNRPFGNPKVVYDISQSNNKVSFKTLYDTSGLSSWPLTVSVAKANGDYITNDNTDSALVITFNTTADSVKLQIVQKPDLFQIYNLNTDYQAGQDKIFKTNFEYEGTWTINVTAYAYSGSYGDPTKTIYDTFVYDSTPPIFNSLSTNATYLSSPNKTILGDTDALTISAISVADTVNKDTPGEPQYFRVQKENGAILLDWTSVNISAPQKISLNGGVKPLSDTYVTLLIFVKDKSNNVSTPAYLKYYIDVTAPLTNQFTKPTSKIMNDTVNISAYFPDLSAASASLQYKHGLLVPNYTEAQVNVVDSGHFIFTIPASAIGSDTVNPVQYYIVTADPWAHAAYIGASSSPETFAVINWPFSVAITKSVDNYIANIYPDSSLIITITTEADSLRFGSARDTNPAEHIVYIAGSNYTKGVSTTFRFCLDKEEMIPLFVTAYAYDGRYGDTTKTFYDTIYFDTTKPVFNSTVSNIINYEHLKAGVISDTDTIWLSSVSAFDTANGSTIGAVYQVKILNGSDQTLLDWTNLPLTSTKYASLNSGVKPATDSAFTIKAIVRDKSYNVSDSNPYTVYIDVNSPDTRQFVKPAFGVIGSNVTISGYFPDLSAISGTLYYKHGSVVSNFTAAAVTVNDSNRLTFTIPSSALESDTINPVQFYITVTDTFGHNSYIGSSSKPETFTVISWPLTVSIVKTVDNYVQNIYPDSSLIMYINTSADSIIFGSVLDTGPVKSEMIFYAGTHYTKDTVSIFRFRLDREEYIPIFITAYAYDGRYGVATRTIYDTIYFDTTSPVFNSAVSNIVYSESLKAGVISDTDTIWISSVSASDTSNGSTIGAVYQVKILNAANATILDWTNLPLSSTKYGSLNNGVKPATDSAFVIKTFVRDKSYNVSDTNSYTVYIDVNAPDTRQFVKPTLGVVNSNVTISGYFPDLSVISGNLYYKHGTIVSNFTAATVTVNDSNRLTFTIPSSALGSDTVNSIQYYIEVTDTYGHTSYIGSSTSPETFPVIYWPITVSFATTVDNYIQNIYPDSSLIIYLNTLADSVKLGLTRDTNPADHDVYTAGIHYTKGITSTLLIHLDEEETLPLFITAYTSDSRYGEQSRTLYDTLYFDMTKPIFNSSVSNIIHSENLKAGVISDTDTIWLSSVSAADTANGSTIGSVYQVKILNVSDQNLLDWTNLPLSSTKYVSVNNGIKPTTDSAFIIKAVVRDKSYNVSDSNPYTVYIDVSAPDTRQFVKISDKVANETVTVQSYFSDLTNISGTLYYKHGSLVSSFTGTAGTANDSNQLTFTIPATAIGADTATPIEYYLEIRDTFNHMSYIGSSSKPETFVIIDWPLIITSPAGSFDTNALTVTVSGTTFGSDPADSVIITNSVSSYSNSAVSLTPFSFSVPLKANEMNTITITGYNTSLAVQTKTVLYYIFCDTLSPTPVSFKINNDSIYSNSLNVTLSISATDNRNLTYMRIGENGVWSDWKAYSTSDALTLSSGDGVKTVTIEYKDGVGNTSSAADTIILDLTAPTASIQINASESTTIAASQLTISASDAIALADNIQITGDITNTIDTLYSTALPVTLSSANGIKTVTITIKDKAGNSVSVSDTIILDNIGPAISHTAVIWGDTTMAIPIKNISTTDLYSKIAKIELYYVPFDEPFSSLTMIDSKNGVNALTSTDTLTIPSRSSSVKTDGYTYYYIKATDILGNVVYALNTGNSAAAPTDTTTMFQIRRIDFSAPVFSLAPANYTNGRSVTVSITQKSITGLALNSLKIYGDIVSAVDTTSINDTVFAVTLTTGSALKTINCIYRDAAGNTSAIGSASIFYDIDSPVLTLAIGITNLTNSLSHSLVYTYSDSTAKGTVTVMATSDVSAASKGDTTISPIPINLTSGDGIKTVTLRVYDSAGNYSLVSDVITLDQSGPAFNFTPVTWADTTQAISIPFSVTDAYSNISTVKLYYLEMDSTAAGTGNLLNTIPGVTSLTLSNTFTIQARTATPADSGYVYYYLESSDSFGNTKYYTINGETSVAPSSINDLIKLLRQDKTPLSLNSITYADALTNTINSRTIVLTGNVGQTDKSNQLYLYNSETGNTTTVGSSFTTTTAFSQSVTFTSDGAKTLIFTASTTGNLPPQNTLAVTLNVDITPPALIVSAPSTGQYLTDTSILVTGRVNHYTKADTVKIQTASNLYQVRFDAADSRIFYCTTAIGGSASGDTLNIIATDFVGNTSVVSLTVYYKGNDTTIRTYQADSAVPSVSIDSTAVISSISFGSLTACTAPTNAEIKINGTDSVSIQLNVAFAYNTAPISVVIKTADDSAITAKIKANSAAEESVKKFGATADYDAGLKTVREFNFSSSGRSINSSENFTSIRIVFTLPEQMRGKYNSVYYFDEISGLWTALSEADLSRGNDTVSAVLTHFSIYGVFAAGAPVQQDLNSVVVFPNPFRPNDGDPRTGVNFSGTLDAGNATGIHISGLASGSKIKIYNILGQTIDEIETLPNQGMAIWDGINKCGEPVASGVYFLVVEGAGQKVVKKLAIIR